MRRRNFNLSLDRILESAVLEADATAAGPAKGGGPDPSQNDPKLKAQQKEAERQGLNKAGAAGGATGGAQPGTGPNVAAGGAQPPKDANAQKAEAEKAKQTQQGSQLAMKMADYDKQIAQLQAKIQGGSAKPAEVAKLSQLLTAKKGIQDQFMKNYGVNPSA